MSNPVPTVLLDPDGNAIGPFRELQVVGVPARLEGTRAIIDHPASTSGPHEHESADLPVDVVYNATLGSAIADHETTEPHLDATTINGMIDGAIDGHAVVAHANLATDVEVAAAIGAHETTEPHLGAGELSAAITAHESGSTHAGLATDVEVAAAVTAHEQAGNPHPTYETSAEAQAKVDAHAAGAAHTGLATDAEVTAAIDAHTSGQPHAAHPNLAAHDSLGLATQSELDAIAATKADTSHSHVDADIPAGIARDSEVTSAIAAHAAAGDPHTGYATDADLSAHAAAADPHTGYQRESEKAAASGYASLDGSTKVPIAQLPTGTSGSTVALGNAPAAAQSAAEATAAAALSAHAAAGDPHSVYETSAEAAAKITTHEQAANPHPTYATDADLTAHAATPHGGGSIVSARKTADQAFSSTSFADSTGLGLPVAASKAYRFRFVIFFTTNAATVGLKLGVNGPASSTVRFGVLIPAAAPSGAGSALIHASGNAYNAEAIAATAGPGPVATMAILEGVVVTGGTAGTLQLRHASETATATTILAQSYGELVEIV